ncbi:hypothetical protein G9A89_005115 [Geosiphon pyriformis]|nr:hypothetical protein G9A89_005115 [Geosiphon pyriformis]
MYTLYAIRNPGFTVIKVKGTGQLIGGYTPQSWHSRDESSDGEGSFIFSLGDDKAGNAKLSKFVGRFGLYGGPDDGPSFGERAMGLTKDFRDTYNYCDKDREYEHAIMPGSENRMVHFSVDEYEVFQIIKR